MAVAITLLFALGLIMFVGTIFAWFARLLRQPLIVAYVLAGVLLGPMVLGLVTDPAEIATLAELGIAFLLFTVGLEIDVQKLRAVGNAALVGGIVQVGVTFALGLLLGSVLGFGNIVGLYIGLLFAFSSTMIVAKILADEHEVGTLHGRIMLGILILQDILVILALPLLGDIQAVLSPELFGLILVKGLGLFSIAIVLNRFLVRKVLHYAARTKEILFLTAVSTCFIFIGLAYVLGFSIAIGAFLGGLAMAQFPYNIEIFGEMRSLRDFFSVIFFTTLGIQLNLWVMYSMFPIFLLFLLMIILAKPLILTLSYLFLGYGGRVSSTIGLGLGQASEFTFIIAAQGLILGHLTQDFYSLIVSLMVVSIIITPYFLKHHTSIYRAFRGLNITHSLIKPRHLEQLENPKDRLQDHIVVFGAGMTGNKIIDDLRKKKEKFVVVEHDPEVMRELRKKDIHCLYGEADNEELLRRAGLFSARLAIITIPDMDEVCFIIQKARRFNPRIKIMARAYTLEQEKELYKKPRADLVIVPKAISAGEMIRNLDSYLKTGRLIPRREIGKYQKIK